MSATLRAGLYLPSYGPFGDARPVADLARDAEASGWDGFFLWDHMAAYDDEDGRSLPCADPWVALTAAAMETTSISQAATEGNSLTAAPKIPAFTERICIS